MSTEQSDPLSKLPSWRLVAILVGCIAAIVSSGYLLVAFLLGWAGVGWSVAALSFSGLVVSLLMPRGAWFKR